MSTWLTAVAGVLSLTHMIRTRRLTPTMVPYIHQGSMVQMIRKQLVSIKIRGGKHSKQFLVCILGAHTWLHCVWYFLTFLSLILSLFLIFHSYIINIYFSNMSLPTIIVCPIHRCVLTSFFKASSHSFSVNINWLGMPRGQGPWNGQLVIFGRWY